MLNMYSLVANIESEYYVMQLLNQKYHYASIWLQSAVVEEGLSAALPSVAVVEEGLSAALPSVAVVEEGLSAALPSVAVVEEGLLAALPSVAHPSGRGREEEEEGGRASPSTRGQ